ncbi:MAG: type II secretion system F family protein [Gammaproteobacteria bacterium]|nr:type II secretion system F family protein [Gammaproteobacteria bacterium]
MNSIIFMSAVASVGISVFLFTWMSILVNPEKADSNRDYMDPLPMMLKPVWGLVKIIEYYIASNLPFEYLDSVDKKLQKSGVSYVVSAEEFFAIRIVVSLLSLFGSAYVMMLTDKFEPVFFLVVPVLAFFFPLVWLSDTKKRRHTQVIRDLPVYLDFITMAVEAGLNLSGALQQSVEKGPKGPLRNEFGIVLRDLRYGLTRTEALSRMAERLDVPDVSNFVNAMMQSEKMGSSMASTLRIQSEQRRNERFQRAEKMAMEAPVKLVFPLIVFIFPVTFIILGFPIVMKFMSEGLF